MANILNLQNVGSIQIVEVDADPSLAATTLPNGAPVPPGSIAFLGTAGVGKGYIKTALAPDTAWAEIDQNNADWSLIGNALTGATPTTPNELFGSSNAYDVRYVRNNSELKRLTVEGNLFLKGNYSEYATLPAAYRGIIGALQNANGAILEGSQFNNGGSGGFPLRTSQGSAGELVTAGATGTLNLSSIPTRSDSVMFVNTIVVGRQTAGSAGVAGNVFTYTNLATVRNVGGVVTVRQQVAAQTYEDDTAGTYDVQMTVLTTNVRPTITQPANRTVKWFAFSEYYHLVN